jgi:hypothetical protein
MKKIPRIVFPLFAFYFSLLTLHAELPQPSVIYYGQAVDEYGVPCQANAAVILRINGVEHARHEIDGAISPGVNFALPVFVDDGNGASYDPAAAHRGDPVTIMVKSGTNEMPILQAGAIPPIPSPGQAVLINVTAGTSTGGDGIPDAWKRELAAWSDGRYADAAHVDMNDDLDGDGFSNLNEFRAGTMAYLDFDYLHIQDWLAEAGGGLRLSFISVPGKAYRIAGAAGPAAGNWAAARYALQPGGPTQMGAFSGDGYSMDVHVVPADDVKTYRMGVEY